MTNLCYNYILGTNENISQMHCLIKRNLHIVAFLILSQKYYSLKLLLITKRLIEVNFFKVPKTPTLPRSHTTHEHNMSETARLQYFPVQPQIPDHFSPQEHKLDRYEIHWL